LLSNIRILLVATTHPGNIGGVARAMKNMGLADLGLVNPKIYPSAEADARAAGAEDILRNAQVFDTLDEALADRQRIIGASARLRTIAWPQLTPRQCADKITVSGHVKTAILFGRERTGLTNAELERCHYLLHIPCNPEFSSLNVAAAVQVVAYELFQAAQALDSARAATDPADIWANGEESARAATDPADIWANGEEMESFHGHLIQTLYDIGFLHERKSSPTLIRRLRRLFNRGGLEKTDIHILRGILAAAQKQAGRHPATLTTPHAGKF
jgi:tRNA (cytidine32/uridine32-2'-O)-methyltransferase